MTLPRRIKPTIDPALTTREACAREIEWMARGHSGHEHIVLEKVAKRIRLLSDENLSNPMSAWLAASVEVLKMRSRVSRIYRHCLNSADQRLNEINLNDPMGPFNDKADWWPRHA